MERKAAEVKKLEQEFESCQGVLLALGDSTRQLIIMEMLQHSSPKGVRAVEIAHYSNLSRQIVSHHLKVLMEAGIVGMREEGTKNYYYFASDESMVALAQTIMHASKMIRKEKKQ